MPAFDDTLRKRILHVLDAHQIVEHRIQRSDPYSMDTDQFLNNDQFLNIILADMPLLKGKKK
jgi:hypothetical protein